jgi:hypothetical protein
MDTRAALTLLKVDFKWNSEAATKKKGERDKTEKHFAIRKSNNAMCYRDNRSAVN